MAQLVKPLIGKLTKAYAPPTPKQRLSPWDRGQESDSALGSDHANPAGATEVFVNRHQPQCSLAVELGGAAPHRGQGIARWLKAEMWRWLRDDEPQVTGLRTGNAHSTRGHAGHQRRDGLPARLLHGEAAGHLGGWLRQGPKPRRVRPNYLTG